MIDFLRKLIPVFRKSVPTDIASQLCDVQPMSGPVGQIFMIHPDYDEASRKAAQQLADTIDQEILEEIFSSAFKKRPYQTCPLATFAQYPTIKHMSPHFDDQTRISIAKSRAVHTDLS